MREASFVCGCAKQQPFSFCAPISDVPDENNEKPPFSGAGSLPVNLEAILRGLE